MRNKEIKEMRMSVGQFLHDYYVKFGEVKYESFIEKLGGVMEKEYGEPFSSENLRIMEAEFVTFNSTIDDKKRKRERTVG